MAGKLTRRAHGTSAVVGIVLLLTVSSCSPYADTRATPSAEASQPSSTATPQVPPTATHETIEPACREELIAAVVAAGAPTLLQAMTSPDGQWRAEVHAFDCVEVQPGESYAFRELRLVWNRDETSTRGDGQLIAFGGLGAYGLAARFWSATSQYLYYTDAAEGVPDGCGYWSPPLIRLDPMSLQLKWLGGAVVSPQADLLAGWQGDRLGIWRVDGPELGSFELPTTMTVPGPMAWNPDGSSLAVLVSEGYCPLGATDLVRLDVADLRPILLLSDHQPAFGEVVWDSPNCLTLIDEDGGRWSFDLLSRDLRPVPP